MSEEFEINRFYEVMKEQDSDAFTFVIEREPEPGRTISEQAGDQMVAVFRAFLAARLYASLQKRGPDEPGHSRIQMDLRLWIDGQSVTVSDDEHPWYSLVDGEHRYG